MFLTYSHWLLNSSFLIVYTLRVLFEKLVVTDNPDLSFMIIPRSLS
jgi:hypothetical protein